MAQIAAVSVENTPFSVDRPFSYWIPEGMTLSVGCRVLVPFGKGNRIRTGIVCSISEYEPERKLKEIYRVLDEEPILSPLQMALCEHLSETCFAPLYSVQNLCVPTALKVKRRVIYKAMPEARGENDRQGKLLDFLKRARMGRNEQQLLEMGFDERDPDLLALLSANMVVKTGDYVRKLGDAGVKQVRLLAEVDEDCRTAVVQTEKGEEIFLLTDKQRRVVRLLSEEAANLKEICYLTGVTASVIDRLADKGIVEYDEIEVYRNPYEDSDQADQVENIILNGEQSKAFETLSALLSENQPHAALLYGVTGSGKTSVFFKLMEAALEQGKGVLFLVPEIALTAQTVRRIHRYFGKQVAVIHSGLGVGERLDEWKRIKRGEAKIVMGTRSAVFNPPENLGLIVMDEEQESGYKSEQTPRFHARNAAKFLAAKENALFVMASATPEIESYHAALNGRYTLCTLKKRYNNFDLPETQIVDMSSQPGKGSERLSDALLEAIDETLSAGEQVILLCNRRGYETTVTCKTCRQVISCPNCSVAMTYHKANGRLMCHYCGHSRGAEEKCPVCGGETMKHTGVGTQKIVQMLQECFPAAKILRMDADTTLTKNAHEKGFAAFAAGEYDILVGTQMVAKGLDFPNVTLVGVLGADRAVYSGDFRGAQRAFNLITQVVGRAGRGEKKGRALIQTLDPDSEAVTLACKQDYEAFYESEIAVRKLLLYPPYCDLCAIGFQAVEEPSLIRGGQEFLQLLTELVRKEYSNLPLKALGPARATVYRAAGFYRSRLLLKCRNTKRFREMLRRVLIEFETDHPDVRVVADTGGLLEF
ncbi:MAG: primosomal protein N' [Oscillospiraceae bacterium]|nr:primosomal protein N' [Oscillospiraceae bacterium]